jgi:hypothetical protein
MSSIISWLYWDLTQLGIIYLIFDMVAKILYVSSLAPAFRPHNLQRTNYTQAVPYCHHAGGRHINHLEAVVNVFFAEGKPAL